jgi:hypothetical protein
MKQILTKMFFLLLLATGIHLNAQTKATPKGTLLLLVAETAPRH